MKYFEARRLLKFPDTKSMDGYDSQGNKKRGRPRGSIKRISIDGVKPTKLWAAISSNLWLEDKVRRGLVQSLIVQGQTVKVLLRSGQIELLTC